MRPFEHYRKRPQTCIPSKVNYGRPSTAKFDKQLDKTIAKVQNTEKNNQIMDLLYFKNIEIKKAINEAVRQNQFMKASIWKHKKQNRKLNEQVQEWHLVKAMERAEQRGAIDPNTMEKVIRNARFKVVSLKLQIEKKQAQFNKLAQILQDLKVSFTSKQSSKEHFERLEIQALSDVIQGLTQQLNLKERFDQIGQNAHLLAQQFKQITEQIKAIEKRIKGVKQKQTQIKEQQISYSKMLQKESKQRKATCQNKIVAGPKNQDTQILQKLTYQLHTLEQQQRNIQFKIQQQEKQFIYKRQQLQKQVRWVTKEIHNLQNQLLEKSRNHPLNDSCRIHIKDLNDE